MIQIIAGERLRGLVLAGAILFGGAVPRLGNAADTGWEERGDGAGAPGSAIEVDTARGSVGEAIESGRKDPQALRAAEGGLGKQEKKEKGKGKKKKGGTREVQSSSASEKGGNKAGRKDPESDSPQRAEAKGLVDAKASPNGDTIVGKKQDSARGAVNGARDSTAVKAGKEAPAEKLGAADSGKVRDSIRAVEEAFGPDSGAVAPSAPMPTAVGTEEARAEMDGAPSLALLPMTVAKGMGVEKGDREKVESALRLGLAESGRFRVWTEEEARARFTGGSLPEECFSERCVAGAARGSAAALVLVSQYSVRDTVTLVRLVLAETPGGKIRRAVQVWGRPGKEGVIPFAREAALRLASGEGDRPAEGVAGMLYAAGAWRDIPWLNPRDTVDNRERWGWAGSGLLLAGLGLAYAQGQLTQEDGNSGALDKDVLSGAGAQSFLRGFFAAPTLGARYAAMGGAGIAQVNNGLALMMNPAGVAEADRENVVAAKRSLPDGTPSFFLAYASPLYHKWAQGVGVQFEGDRIANETTLDGALACDLGGLGRAWEGIKAGAQVKLYLAQVGEGGVGLDRSTGRSFGMGLDLGMQARLSDKITAALAVRDAASFLRHSNTLTDQSYAEVLPTEYRIGAAYRATSSLLLLMDGQKAAWADQVDHLRLGGEQTVFRFLALRCGLHEIFGREEVRKMSVGFGLDTDGLGDNALKMKIVLNYGYEFGLNEDEPLGGGQQFSLEAGF
jgi:hypothetical protein